MAAKHVGIVAGTAEGAALCYRTLAAHADTLLPRDVHPHISVHAFPQSAYLALIEHDDWNGVAALLSRSAATLVQAGADLIICPNNTLHRAMEFVMPPVPWLHIVDVVTEEAVRHGYRQVGVLGTQIVMGSTLYLHKLADRGIEPLIPNENERIQIQHIIRTELIAGRFTHKSRTYLSTVIARMAARGAEAVILGCTELPLLLAQEHSPLPLLNSTGLLTEAAIRCVAGDRRKPPVWIHATSSTDYVSHA